MTQKNDTPVLIAALLITATLLGLGGWWLTKSFNSGGNLSLPGVSSNSSTPGSAPSRDRTTDVLTDIPSVATFADVTDVPSGSFNYGGSTTWAPIRRDLDSSIMNVHPSFQLQYTNPTTGAPGSTPGIQMLLENQLAFSQSSRSLNPDEIDAAQQQGISLRAIPVALEGIAVAVNPELNVTGLTVDQLRDIYTGQLTNWNEVGGPDLEITPYSRRPEQGGTVEFFVASVLEGQSFGGTTTFIATTTEALRAVSVDPGGIYYASAPEVVDQCTTKPLALGQTSDRLVPLHHLPLVPPSACPTQRNRINVVTLIDGSYPLTRQLLVIIKENGQIEQEVGEAYATLLLSREGQALLGQSGFMGIR